MSDRDRSGAGKDRVADNAPDTKSQEALAAEGRADAPGGEGTLNSGMDRRARKAGATHGGGTGVGPGQSASGGSVGGIRIPGTDDVTGSTTTDHAKDGESGGR